VGKPHLKELVARAMTDPSFLHQLLFSPHTATAGFTLSDIERQVLTAHSPEDLLGLAVRGSAEFACTPATCESTCQLTCTGTLNLGNRLAPPQVPALQQVVARARSDPQFFARLQADPEAALAGIELTPADRATLGANTAERLMGVLVARPSAGCGSQGTCGSTCAETCSHTCSGGYTMSCGDTCAHTCNYTAGRVLVVPLQA